MAGATANSVSGGCEKAPVDYSGSNNPLDGVDYSNKVKTQMENKTDFYHSFQKSVDAFADSAKKQIIYDYEGNPVTEYVVEGSYKGIDGNFEYIINQNGIDHRLFVPK